MEVLRALGVLLESPGPSHPPLARLLELGEAPGPELHQELFGFELYPYASVYLGPEGALGGEARDRIAGFWRALGLSPPPEPDHLALLLAAYAGLCERQTASTGEEGQRLAVVRRAFLWEHLLSWLPPWLEKLAEIADPFYRCWGAMLTELVAGEVQIVGEPEALPLHLRQAPPLADPRTCGGVEFARSLLAPVRSGMIVIRRDLGVAAGELGLGLRVGERRFALEALLSQSPARTLGWFESEARRWVDRHRRNARFGDRIAGFWSDRAAATADLLGALRRALPAGGDDRRP